MTLGLSWICWRRPAAPHGQLRRVYSGVMFERSRDVVVGRVFFEVYRATKNWVCGGLDCFRGSHVVKSVLTVLGKRAAAAAVVLALPMLASPFSISRRHCTTLHVAGVGYMKHAMPRYTNSANRTSILDNIRPN